LCCFAEGKEIIKEQHEEMNYTLKKKDFKRVGGVSHIVGSA